jgi:ATP-dependent helicase HepA
VALLKNGIALVHGDNRVFAKVVDLQEDNATIEYFHSVAQRITENVNVASLSRLILPRETRVFVETSPGYWRVGRVKYHHDEDDDATLYEVRFPNAKNQEVLETDLYVRCLDVYADPAEALAAGCSETQFLADRRRIALRTIRSLRSACEGLTGLYSSAIDLMPHQISTVRKVLQDNLVRYLLADEVGLGKTIEAGAIMRQMLLDRRELQVLVLVPENLVFQWREELHRRFFIDPASPSVNVLAYDCCTQIARKPDLLVVDEAHRVIATGDAIKEGVAAVIEELAHSVESLLLLSATPALGDEARLFGLLQLLDPSAYPKKDLEGFRRKVESRQEIGRLLLTMQPGGTPFVVKSQAKGAQNMFPDDQFVNLTAQDILDSGEDAKRRDQAVVLLRDHIARTYRIHDRLIRSRRIDAEKWAIHPRGKDYPNLSHVRMAFDETTWASDLFSALESWRVAASAVTFLDRTPIISRWRELVSASFLSRAALSNSLRAMEPMFDDEPGYLSALVDIAKGEFDQETRMASICEELKSWRDAQTNGINRRVPSIICFVSDADDAADLNLALRKRFGPFAVLNVSDKSDEIAWAQNVAEFEKDPESWILIGNRDAEEGLNLQFVDAIFHVDLPTDVARLEQRIGRLDRIGRRSTKLEHRLFLPNDDEDAPWYAWMDILMNGFRIFNGSVSDIQFKLNDLELIIWTRMLDEGPSCAMDLSENVVELIAEERKKLNEQHALDEIARLRDDSVPLVNRMEEAEEDEENLNSSVSGWMNGVLQLDQSPANPGPQETHRIFWNRPLLPRIPWQRVLEASLDKPLTWHRKLAQSAKENPTLLRPGAPLLNALERISNWDDKGSVYATWWVDPSVEDIWVGFRWVWILSPGLSSETAVWQEVERPDLYRRTEHYLPILTIDLCTDFDGELVTDDNLIKRVNRPCVRNPTDQGIYNINLGSRPEALEEIVDPIVLRKTLSDVRQRVMDDTWENDKVSNAIERARTRFERDDALLRRSLDRREAYLWEEFGQVYDGVEGAIEDLESIREAIENPQLRLDECGLIVLSPEAPDAGGQ